MQSRNSGNDRKLREIKSDIKDQKKDSKDRVKEMKSGMKEMKKDILFTKDQIKSAIEMLEQTETGQVEKVTKKLTQVTKEINRIKERMDNFNEDKIKALATDTIAKVMTEPEYPANEIKTALIKELKRQVTSKTADFQDQIDEIKSLTTESVRSQNELVSVTGRKLPNDPNVWLHRSIRRTYDKEEQEKERADV